MNKLNEHSLWWAYGFEEEEWFCLNKTLLKLGGERKETNKGRAVRDSLIDRSDLVRCKTWSHYPVSFEKLDQKHRYIYENELYKYENKHQKFSSSKMLLITRDLQNYKRQYYLNANHVRRHLTTINIDIDDWVNSLFYFSKNEIETFIKQNSWSFTTIYNKEIGWDIHYYLDYYYRKNSWNFHQDRGRSVEMSKKIIDFKDGKSEAIDFFLRKLDSTFNYCINGWRSYAIAMCPSSVKSNTNMGSSMELLIKKLIKSNPSIINLSDLFLRKESITPSHKGGIRDTEEHINTIKLNVDLLKKEIFRFQLDVLKKDKSFPILIMDDVLTSGSTINSCEYLLRKEFNKNKILKFTLGKTFSPKYYTYKQIDIYGRALEANSENSRITDIESRR